ncbi:phage tail tube protein [Photorhabdus tasmaniensis]|uniref:Phage tail protein n=1 Tax=Photorhabdus tasmaniensis TaxID=1004159 RepID=A0ABX0GK48_9GAMM|nr:phage tail tube protein [Photorhabdus tasmaniensis]NHB89191.1 phage tail protein [Photorhabdus tasmaniensis]
MASPYQYTGIAYIRLNGKEIQTKDGAQLTPGGVTRDPVIGSRVYGWQQTPKEARLSCVIPQGPGVSLFMIKNMVDATIEFECDTGERFMLANAWCDGNVSLTSKGEISAEFIGIECKEI